MQTSSYAELQTRYRNLATRSARQDDADGFLQTHHIADIARGLFLSSLLWIVLAFVVYTVYSMIVGAR